MKKVGVNINFRLSVGERNALDAVSSSQGKNRSELLREIIEEYTRNPEPITLAFVERVKKALLYRESRPAEERVQINAVMPPELIEALKLLSDQTGLSIEALVSLMISGHMVRLRMEAQQ